MVLKMSPPPLVEENYGDDQPARKFTPNLSELTQPLRELLSKNSQWLWGLAQSSAFTRIKEELSKTTTLALYDPDALTKMLADASSYGLGAILLQRPQSSVCGDQLPLPLDP